MDNTLILAVVSGKGGVGKTMLSVAMANELVRTNKTLLMDLDFFNRGLTGLFSSVMGKAPHEKVPALDLLNNPEPATGWDAVLVKPNLYIISYEDVDRLTANLLDMMEIQTLADALSKFLKAVAKRPAVTRLF